MGNTFKELLLGNYFTGVKLMTVTVITVIPR
jgi:hypothetical protein